MKILFVHNCYSSHSGEEQSFYSIADLLKSNHEIIFYIETSEKIKGNPLLLIWAFISGIYNPFSVFKIRKKIREQKPDLVFVQNLFPFISVSILSEIKKQRIPIVMRCPNYRLFCPTGLHYNKNAVCEKCLSKGKEFWCIKNNCEKNIVKSLGYALRNAVFRLRKSFIKNIDIFIVQSEFQRRKFIANGIDPLKLEIVSGFSRFIPILDDSYTFEFDIAFIGRISKEKGINDLIEVAKKNPEFRLVICGDGPELNNYRILRIPNIIFTGFLTGEKLSNIYKNSKIIVLTSHWYEGFPNVLVNAMLWAKPIIVSEIGAFTSIISDGINGLFYEHGNPLDLVDKIKLLISNPTLCIKLGKNAREKAILEYNADSIKLKLESIFYKLF